MKKGLWVKHAKRNQAIVDLYLAKHTMRYVGNAFGLTSERIRVILNKSGINTKPSKPVVDKKAKTERRFWSRVDRQEDIEVCWSWQGKTQTAFGYGRMSFLGKPRYSHHLAWYFYHGYFSTKWILHDCGNSSCCNPHHLKEGTPSENAIDRFRHARKKNITHPRAKLSIEQVKQIKLWLKDKTKTRTVIANQLGVSYETIRRIDKGEYWQNITT